MNLERLLPTDESIGIAKKYLDILSIDTIIENYISTNKNISASKIMLINNNKKSEIISSGKGNGNQSIASGLFEALEHHFHYNYRRYIDENCLCTIEIDEILRKNVRLIEHYPIKFLANKIKTPLECIKFRKVDSEKKYIYIPTFLVFPTENQDPNDISNKLTKYMSNNGCAIGVNAFEALIHAINEVIERDSLSKHYIDSIYKNRNEIRVIDKKSLPINLFHLVEDIELSIKSKINIIDITYTLGFPTYYVWAVCEGKPLPLKGSGTSIFSEYALERSLAELFQAYKMYDLDDYKQDLYTKSVFKSKNKFNKLINCNYNDFVKIKLSFLNQITLDDMSLTNILEYMIKHLKQNNYEVYYCTIYNANDLSCVKVFIPGTEVFHRLNYGIFTLPNNYEKVIKL